MTAEERGAKWIAEIDTIDRMTPDECRRELRNLASHGGVIGAVATASMVRDQISRNHCGRCPHAGGCIVCTL